MAGDNKRITALFRHSFEKKHTTKGLTAALNFLTNGAGKAKNSKKREIFTIFRRDFCLRGEKTSEGFSESASWFQKRKKWENLIISREVEFASRKKSWRGFSVLENGAKLEKTFHKSASYRRSGAVLRLFLNLIWVRYIFSAKLLFRL